MKNVIVVLAVLIFGFTFTANGQEKGKFRVGLDLGYTVPMAGGGGLLYYLEPKYNIRENMNIGLRIGGATMLRDIVYSSNTNAGSAKISVNISYVLTYDYYFKTEGSSFAPFVGGGIGWMRFASLDWETTADPEDFGFLGTRSTIAPVLRAGFEAAKFRFSLDYNIVPKSDLVNSQGTVIGETGNAYLGIAIGFYVGGGKWRN
ncbi:hypothetical protein [Aquiflexum lacus]|uniref:hypothetical protein n=1 Tax=Aquiflexum lacus TaxID=2483805 RepID=UPI001893F8D9|nr:hypothetical protein [Aquiflexum lacus]